MSLGAQLRGAVIERIEWGQLDVANATGNGRNHRAIVMQKSERRMPMAEISRRQRRRYTHRLRVLHPLILRSEFCILHSEFAMLSSAEIAWR
jgi:hypothetical protein